MDFAPRGVVGTRIARFLIVMIYMSFTVMRCVTRPSPRSFFVTTLAYPENSLYNNLSLAAWV